MKPTTDRSTRRPNRRRFLTGLGAAGAALGALPTSTLANDGENEGRQSLATGSLDFTIFSSRLGEVSDDDPDTVDEFGYPDDPMFRFHDHSGTAFFDPSQIVMTPDGTTLHHALRFFNGWLIDRRPKPYVLVHEANGRYTERGQTMSFTAKTEAEIQAQLDQLAEANQALFEEVSARLTPEPLFALAGKRWRAVGNDIVQLVAKNDPRPRYALTRIDFYTQRGGKAQLSQSLLYVLWPRSGADPDEFAPGPMPDEADSHAQAMIAAGKANLGGQ